MAECINSQSKLWHFLEKGLENRRGRAKTSVDGLPQAQESCFEAVHCGCNKGCPAQSNVGRKVQRAPHDAQSNSGEHCQEED